MNSQIQQDEAVSADRCINSLFEIFGYFAQSEANEFTMLPSPEQILSLSSIEKLKGAYPASPAVLSHGLADHPLLAINTLAKAALRMTPHHVERRQAHTANGEGFPHAAQSDVPIDQVILDIAASGSWVMLRFIEQLPEYRDLLNAIMAELGPVIGPATGPGDSIKGFVFISAPGTLTPLHFDAEYNILLHILGDKEFATYPPRPPYLLAAHEEAYHLTGESLLPVNESFASAELVHRLEPGHALYVPYASPHWVKAGMQPCISLSITWQSKWSRRNADALLLNHGLRQKGIALSHPPAWPASSIWRSLAYRSGRKLGLL